MTALVAPLGYRLPHQAAVSGVKNSKEKLKPELIISTDLSALFIFSQNMALSK